MAGTTGLTGPAGPAGSVGATGPAGPAGSSVTITGLAQTATIASADLVGVSQSGADHAITFANFLSGETGDQLPAAAPVSATDTFLTLQGGSTTYTQPASAIWAWIAASQIHTYKRPVVELSGTGMVGIDGSAHNGCDLVCSGAVTLTPLATMGSGFGCRVFNVSGASVTLSGFTTSNGGTSLPTGAACLIDTMVYSGGTLNFANLGGASGTVTTPGQVTGLGAGAITSSSVALAWGVPGTGGAPSSYTVNVAPHGTTTWTGASVAGTSATVTGLTASTSYDFQVIAVNAAGSGAASATLSAVSTIAAPTTAPGPVTSLAAGTPTQSAVPLTWAAPTTGGAVSSYNVNYQVTGAGGFTPFATGLTATSVTVTGLTAATAYTFQVVAVNGVGTAPAIVSATTAATLAVPGQPSALTAGTTTASTVPLTWTAPTAGGAVATYTMQQSPHGAATWTNCAGGTGLTTTSFAATGLSASTAYDFQVIAVNASGSGTPSALATGTTIAAGGTYALTQGYTSQPTIGNSYARTSTVGCNLNDNSTTGGKTVPTGVSIGLSASNTVAPTGAALQACTSSTNGGQHYWAVYYNAGTGGAALAAGTYYVWGIAYNGATQVATYTSADTITLT